MSSADTSPETMDEFLADIEPKLKAVAWALLGSIKKISEAIRSTPLDKAEGGGTSFNQFGDRQLEIDVLSDKLMFDGLRSSECCEVRYALCVSPLPVTFLCCHHRGRTSSTNAHRHRNTQAQGEISPSSMW